jgi:hypothetical protein
MAGTLAQIAIAWLFLAGAPATVPATVQDRSVTLTGCVERDAAASAPIYKLIVPQADSGPVIYQLNAPGNAAVAAAVGKTAQVTGSVTQEKRSGREVRILTVGKFEVVADRCK